MLEKGRVVRARPECAYAQILTLTSIAASFRRAATNRRELVALPRADVRLGIRHVLLDAIDEVLERVRAFDLEVAATVRVAVEIGDRVLAQVRGVRFGPLGRAEETGLFTVPGRIDDRALRPPALLVQLA